MERYWIYIDSKVQGPVEVPALRKVSGFTLLTQVCPENEQTWRVADDIIEIKAYFLAPPRASSIPQSEGNLAVKVEPEVRLEAPPSALSPMPSVIETLPELPPMTAIPLSVELPSVELPKGLPVPSAASAASTAPAAGSSGALRLVCSVCGYKNPRDLTNCMKCGTALDAAAAASLPAAATAPVSGVKPTAAPSVSPTLRGELPTLVKSMEIPAPASSSAAPIGTSSLKPDSAMVEIPLSKIIGMMAIAAAIVGGGWGLQRVWKKHHHAKAVPVVPVVAEPEPMVTHRTKHHVTHNPHRRYVLKNTALPGVSDTAPAETPAPEAESTPAPTPVHHTRKHAARAVDDTAATSTDAPATDQPVSYHVLPEAEPLKKREHAPLNSTYAQKRRADHGLWSGQEGQAIQQVQNLRIYGGQRTVQRNVEILMQILRDREYTTAFETGKRLNYYDDMDWAANPTSGPVYEVELTFSGGKEIDGVARRPLRFAFAADLERGTVDPSGPDTIRSNTMHAFFDESRIAPDERRAIAKDTEELVLAAQPDASPLALDTIVHHFVGTYGSDSLKRVATAYNLTLVKKKMAHDPMLTGGAMPPAVLPGVDERPAPADAILPKPSARTAENTSDAVVPQASATKKSNGPAHNEQLTSTSGPIDFQIENGSGRERNVTLRVPTKATTAQLWETLTGYDRYQQFIPGMLESGREGQDGGAVIVHTVTLTRFWFFVFKINLHLRVIEHPLEHTLEFERIAGEFENFRGSVQLQMEPGGHTPTLTFRATVVPKGHVPDYIFREMTRHLLVSALDAIRAHAEAQ